MGPSNPSRRSDGPEGDAPPIRGVEPIGLLTGVPGLCLSESRRPGRGPTSVGCGGQCLVLSCPEGPRRAARRRLSVSCPVLSCPVLSCPVKKVSYCPVLSWEVSNCPVTRRRIVQSWHETHLLLRATVQTRHVRHARRRRAAAGLSRLGGRRGGRRTIGLRFTVLARRGGVNNGAKGRDGKNP